MQDKIDWIIEYQAKDSLLEERGFPAVDPMAFYRDLFPAGSLQKERNEGKGNIIASQVRTSKDGRTKSWIVDDSLEMLEKVMGDPFGLIPPISFFGKTHKKRTASQLFAIAIDVDFVTAQNVKNLMKQFGNGVQLCPSYLVSSGKGVHLYYLLQEPVQLYPWREHTLGQLKEALILRLWNDTSSAKPEKPDITGIYQGFRCVGSQSKLGEDYPVKAYKISNNRYTLEQIRDSIPGCEVDLSAMDKRPDPPKGRMTLDKAKELYPDWYQSKIVEGKPKNGTWTCKPALYEWWKGKILTNVKAGGRYYAIMALCAYGLKCGIPEEQIKQDAMDFLAHLESLTEDEDNHFTAGDLRDALRALKADNRTLSKIASRAWIEKSTKVEIPPNKRNWRKQEIHIKYMNLQRAFKVELGECTKGGRPRGSGEKAAIVRQWRAENPKGRKIDCARETGLSRPTVQKWWDA